MWKACLDNWTSLFSSAKKRDHTRMYGSIGEWLDLHLPSSVLHVFVGTQATTLGFEMKERHSFVLLDHHLNVTK